MAIERLVLQVSIWEISHGKCMLTLECSCQTSLAGLNAMR